MQPGKRGRSPHAADGSDVLGPAFVVTSPGWASCFAIWFSLQREEEMYVPVYLKAPPSAANFPPVAACRLVLGTWCYSVLCPAVGALVSQ